MENTRVQQDKAELQQCYSVYIRVSRPLENSASVVTDLDPTKAARI